MPEASGIYEGHDVCDEFAANEWCFRIKRYRDGEYENLVHEHVPRRRMSEERALSALKALIPTLNSWCVDWVISSYKNGASGGGEPYPGFRSHVSHPCEGMVRKYICSGNTTAWLDKSVRASGR